MASSLDIDTTVSPEGRVVIPAAVREILGVRAGDRVRFEVREGTVRLLSARSLLAAVWANNDDGEAGDSVVDIRQARAADQDASVQKWARLDAGSSREARSDEAVEARILAELDLA